MTAKMVSPRRSSNFQGKDKKEQWLNWYLTKQFIAGGSCNIPDDECLKEARLIIRVLAKMK